MFEKLLLQLSYYDNFTLSLFFLLENLVLLILSIITGSFIDKEVATVKKTDIKWIISSLLCNTAITLIGYKLFQYNIIKIDFHSSISSLLFDIAILILLMDFFMFIFHYLAHKLTWFAPIHQLHHTHIETNVYSLFVLNPIETLGFGFIWLFLIAIIQFNFFSIIVYLILNLTYGILGHVKKDLFPAFWNSNIFTKWISTTKFHSNHHKNQAHNFGFYFTIWDKIFKTNV